MIAGVLAGLSRGAARHGAVVPAANGVVQASVLSDGFAVTHSERGGHRIVELDANAVEQDAFSTQVADDVRAVGTRVGTAIAWQEGRKLRLVRGKDDRDLGTWGSSVRQLCEGFASNDLRFAVGWLESDDNVWIVHGPLAKAAAEPAAASLAVTADAPAAAAPRNAWCGIASAENNVAMLWRGGDRLNILMCGKKRCDGLPGVVTLDLRVAILGFGCLRNACLIASRDTDGTLLSYVTTSGRTKWTRPIAPSSAKVSILGYGDRAFAVGYVDDGGARVLRFDTAGASSPLWQDAASTEPPALAWSSGRLLIARHRGGALAHDVIAAPR